MSQCTAIISMLHEGIQRHSAQRTFHGEPVLAWTLRRLAGVSCISAGFVLCWDDQSPMVAEVQRPTNWSIACKGKRRPIESLDAVSAAGRWMDGWRGGLLQTCDFDIGFYGPWIKELAGETDVLLIDPASGLLDTAIIEKLFDRAQEQGDLDLFFTQAAPGIAGVIIRNSLLAQLAAANQHPGKLLHYLPDRPSRDPIAGEACVEVPMEIARTTRRFKLDSQRQIDWLESVEAKSAIELVKSAGPLANTPREVVVELTTRRSTFPAFGAARHFPVNRENLSIDQAKILFHEVAEIDDLRLTFGGVGDPLCHPRFFEIAEVARAAGIEAIHVETDLYDVDSAQVAGLAEAGIDIVSVNIPALTAATYHKLMGIDGYAQVIANIRQLVQRRQGLSRGTPIVVPTFVKCRDNFAEMESWYDQWLRALGTAVITGPSDCAGRLPAMAVAEMAPPGRKPCARLEKRITILADGRIVSCEQDVFGRQVLGEIGRDSIGRVWNESYGSLRADHVAEQWQRHPLCATCGEWHRP